MTEGSTMPARRSETSLLWASGLAIFGGVLLLTGGFLQLLQGLSAVFNDNLYVTGLRYVYQFDLTVWGWIHVLVGLIAVAIGVTIVMGKTFGYVLGIVIAALSALTNFLFMPYYPLWSIILIAIDVAIIWALSVLLGQRST